MHMTPDSVLITCIKIHAKYLLSIRFDLLDTFHTLLGEIELKKKCNDYFLHEPKKV